MICNLHLTLIYYSSLIFKFCFWCRFFWWVALKILKLKLIILTNPKGLIIFLFYLIFRTFFLLWKFWSVICKIAIFYLNFKKLQLDISFLPWALTGFVIKLILKLYLLIIYFIILRFGLSRSLLRTFLYHSFGCWFDERPMMRSCCPLTAILCSNIPMVIGSFLRWLIETTAGFAADFFSCEILLVFNFLTKLN